MTQPPRPNLLPAAQSPEPLHPASRRAAPGRNRWSMRAPPGSSANRAARPPLRSIVPTRPASRVRRPLRRFPWRFGFCRFQLLRSEEKSGFVPPSRRPDPRATRPSRGRVPRIRFGETHFLIRPMQAPDRSPLRTCDSLADNYGIRGALNDGFIRFSSLVPAFRCRGTHKPDAITVTLLSMTIWSLAFGPLSIIIRPGLRRLLSAKPPEIAPNCDGRCPP